MTPVRLTDAIRLAERTDDPIPLVPRQGKCEAQPNRTGIPCGQPARWWEWNELRCDEHHETPIGAT